MKSFRIAIFFLLLLIVAFLSLAGRCFYLQHFRNNHYIDISTKQQQKLVTQKPQRGEILDCRGRVLAASNNIHTIKAEPRIIEDLEGTSTKLAPILRMDSREIYKIIAESRNPGFAKLMVGADLEQCKKVRRIYGCLLYTSPSPRDQRGSRMPSSA